MPAHSPAAFPIAARRVPRAESGQMLWSARVAVATSVRLRRIRDESRSRAMRAEGVMLLALSIVPLAALGVCGARFAGSLTGVGFLAALLR